MAIPRAGLLIGSGLMVAFAALLLSFEPHWFSVIVLLLGCLGIGLSFVEGSQSSVRVVSEARDGRPLAPAAHRSPPVRAPAEEGFELQQVLGELKRLRSEGILSAAEHNRKRAELIGAWGRPEAR